MVCQNHVEDENGKRSLPCAFPVFEKLRNIERVTVPLHSASSKRTFGFDTDRVR